MDETVFDLTLTTDTYGGDALGRLADGRAVFVPFGIPGERVRVRIVEEHGRYTRAVLLEVLEPSPLRIAARCAHFGICGGCHYQNRPYGEQLKAKEAIFRDQLERIGGIPDPPVRPIVPSPAEYYYRNHVQFHLAENGALGYQAAGSHRVIAIRECHLPEGPLNDLWPLLDFAPGTQVERVGLRLGDAEDAMLVLESDDPLPPELLIEAPVSAVHLGPGGATVLSGEEALQISVLGRPFQVSAGAFFQVNTPQAENMVRHILERLPGRPGLSLLDVYCGVGLFSAFLAPHVDQLVGVEFSEAACTDFAANLDEFDHVSLYQGAAEEVLPAIPVHPEVILVDPPRAGLERAALQAMLDFKAETVAYVSCDPATLARDAKRMLAAGYRLVEATPFDLFPQTYHIESISFFKRS